MNDLVFRSVSDSMQETETRYEVYVDNDDLNLIFNVPGFSFDLGDEEANEAYTDRFRREELCSFGVLAKSVCKCCNQWSEKDSLWAIHAESPEDALEYYKEHVGK